MTTAERQDRATVWVLIVAITTFVVTVGASAVLLPQVIDTRSAVQAQRRAEAVSSCRSEIRSRLDLATAELDDLTLDLLVGIADGLTISDDAVILAGDIEGVREALAKVEDARAKRRAAVDAVRAAAEEAAKDPDGFLRGCGSGDG